MRHTPFLFSPAKKNSTYQKVLTVLSMHTRQRNATQIKSRQVKEISKKS